jgi:hypothetical protein
MQIYHYDQNTGEYLGTTAAQIDPMATQREGKEVYLLPACATTVGPLTDKEGCSTIFDGQEWRYIEIPRPPEPEPAPEPTAEEIQAQMKKQAISTIQAILDSKAKDLGFDTIHTAAVWTISKNPARKARADALVAWGDTVWDFAEAEWEKQSEGKGTFTTVDEFLAALPKFPGVVA